VETPAINSGVRGKNGLFFLYIPNEAEGAGFMRWKRSLRRSLIVMAMVGHVTLKKFKIVSRNALAQ
jgi:hypothetical protein